jgi:hypothetical protein
LRAITISNGVTNIGRNAFSGCTWLKKVIIPDGLSRIDDYAFSNCTRLTTVHISSIESWCNISFGGIEANPLKYAKNLYLNGELVTELVIPDGVKSINDYAFYGCARIDSIIIPNSVKNIGRYAFEACTDLTSVYYEGTPGEWESIDIMSATHSVNATLLSATRYYYSETLPVADGHLYWHYDETGNIVLWE